MSLAVDQPAAREMSDRINAVPWSAPHPPRRVLAIRLQALGDLIITLPYLESIKRLLPTTEIDLLTRQEVADIPRNLVLFDRVFAIGGGRNPKRQLLLALGLVPRLRARRYDVVIDLQRNRVSRWVRKALGASCWSEFDRFSPLPHGERARRTIEAAGFRSSAVYPGLSLKHADLGLDQLEAAGWRPECDLVVLNPAGGFPSRNWPLQNYVDFARLWRDASNRCSQFVVLGLDSMRTTAAFLQAQLGACLLDLAGRTSPAEAFAIVRRATFVLSEDSGLMHMAWISGVPTLALFGSSRADWSAPQGSSSLCLHSGDLPCGACMQAECQFGDVHCLTRYTPAMVLDAARQLLARSAGAPRVIWTAS